ncbi:PDZ domain-containing protein [Luteolibacter marinus]|uniref:PDZ domain-containing protein n=1 Tax=Luteolibacter marinus TaxID=2776705 RepID=UPI001866AC9D|nr:PDZ domain-containing protein [Luteolibacter marinus]
MKPKSLILLLNAALLAAVHAQRNGEAPLMRPEEVQAVQDQTIEFFDAIRPVARDAMRSTVWVWADTGRGKQPVVLGTVVEDGTKVLTKWSEIAMTRGDLQVVGGDGVTAKASVLGVHQEEDLALLQLEGASFPAVAFDAGDAPKLGRFLVAASPDDTPVSVGVVAVEARSLREKDQAFLGVELNPLPGKKGLEIVGVQDGSAASAAGLRPGDVIQSLGDHGIGSLLELQTALAGHVPGDTVKLGFLRADAAEETEATLQEKNVHYPQVENQRLNQMERMGSRLSLVRSGFPRVIQTDMQLNRDQCGGPVVDLDGKVVGIVIARADRTRSFVIPSASIVNLLSKNPVSPEVAQAEMEAERLAQNQQVGQRGPRQRNLPPSGPRPRPQPRAVPIDPDAADRMRGHLEEMQLLMERMRAEMEAIENR